MIATICRAIAFTAPFMLMAGTTNPSVLQELAMNKQILMEGTDAELRPLFVSAQAEMEKRFVEMLRSKEAVSVYGVIHTPAPATPLCTAEQVTQQLVDTAILNDPARLATVKERTDILRALLASGATIVSAYPQDGRNLRTAEQLAIFDELSKTHPNLSSAELAVSELPSSMSGATYWIQRANGERLLFSIMSYQADRPTDGVWGLWFGEMSDPKILKRAEEVESFLQGQGLAIP